MPLSLINDLHYLDTVSLAAALYGFIHMNPFLTNVPLLYPLKTSENLRFSDDFRGYRGGTLVENGLKTECKFFEKLVLFSDIPYYTHMYVMNDKVFICLFSFACFITDIIGM